MYSSRDTDTFGSPFGGIADRIPRNLRTFNKVGDAYDFLTDAAYVIDLDNNVGIVLATTKQTNANEIFNDSHCENEQFWLPFLRDTGQANYELDSVRHRTDQTDLSRFTALE